MKRKKGKINSKFRERKLESSRAFGGEFVREQFSNDKGSTSFFFSNFSDDHGMEEMWKFFLHWGRVIDIYISLRKDKTGRKFGFVKFIDVIEPNVLDKDLQVTSQHPTF